MTNEKPLRFVIDLELTDREIHLIGQIVAGWGMLEFTIFIQTLDSFKDLESEDNKLPGAMNNLQFSGVLDLWEERVVGHADEKHQQFLRDQLEEIRKLKPARDALVHGMWRYAKADISKIKSIRIRKKEVIEFEFSAEDLEDFQKRLADVNSKITYPGGIKDWAESLVEEDGSISHVSRRFLAMMTGSEIVEDWHVQALEIDELDSNEGS